MTKFGAAVYKIINLGLYSNMYFLEKTSASHSESSKKFLDTFIVRWGDFVTDALF